MARNVQVGVTITGKDDGATAVLGKVGNAAENTGKKIDELGKQTKRLQKHMDDKWGGAGLALGAIAIAGEAVHHAFDMMIKNLAAMAPDFATLTREATRSEAALAMIAETVSDPAFTGVAGTIAQMFAIADEAITKSSAKNEQEHQQFMRNEAERRASLNARLSLLDDEAQQSKISIDDSMNNLKKLQMMEEHEQERHKARAEERKRIRDKEAQDRQEKERFAAKYTEQMENGVQQIQEDNFNRNSTLIEQNEQMKLDAIQKEMDAEMNRAQETATMIQGVGQAWGSAFEQVAAGQKELGDAVLDATLDSFERIIMAAAAVAAANAFAAHQVVPFIGIALGTAAAGVAFAMVRGYVSQMRGPKKMAKGGRIEGGTPGVDSVPILAMPGERVLTVDQNRNWERLMGLSGGTPATGSGHMANGGVVPRSVGGGGVVVHASFNSVVPTDRTTRKKALREMKDELLELLRPEFSK